MAEENCTNCRFYVGHNFGGQCHRHAPVRIDPRNGVPQSEFPAVSGWTEWCGDHERSTASAAADGGAK